MPPDGVQQTLKVAQLETLVAKFGFQKQARTTNATREMAFSPRVYNSTPTSDV